MEGSLQNIPTLSLPRNATIRTLGAPKYCYPTAQEAFSKRGPVRLTALSRGEPFAVGALSRVVGGDPGPALPRPYPSLGEGEGTGGGGLSCAPIKKY